MSRNAISAVRLGPAVLGIIHEVYSKGGQIMGHVIAGNRPPAGEVEACVLAVWVRRSWQQSVEVYRRHRWPNADTALAWAKGVEGKLARRHDVLAAGTLYFPTSGVIPDDAGVVAQFRDLMRDNV